MRNFQFGQSIMLPRIMYGKWLLDIVLFAEGLEYITFHMQVVLEVKPIGWRWFGIA